MSWTLEQIKVYYRLRIHYTEVSEGLGKQQLMLIRRGQGHQESSIACFSFRSQTPSWAILLKSTTKRECGII